MRFVAKPEGASGKWGVLDLRSNSALNVVRFGMTREEAVADAERMNRYAEKSAKLNFEHAYHRTSA